MKKDGTVIGSRNNRRSFLKNGMVAAGAMTASVGLVSSSAAFADADDHGVACLAESFGRTEQGGLAVAIQPALEGLSVQLDGV